MWLNENIVFVKLCNIMSNKQINSVSRIWLKSIEMLIKPLIDAN
jgi:hypothetical protein